MATTTTTVLETTVETTGQYGGTSGAVDSAAVTLIQTSSEASISVSLSDVPEGKLSDKDSAMRQNNSDTAAVGKTAEFGRFLFHQINAGSPLLSLFPAGGVNPVEGEYRQHQNDRVHQEQVIENVVVGSSAAVSTGVSVGYVVWLLRGGSLLTTFLSSLPAWQAFDPLAVLESFGEEGNEADDDESLVSLVSGGD